MSAGMYWFAAIRLTVSLAQIMRHNQWYPSAWDIVWKWKFDRWTLFIHWSVVRVNSTCIMIRHLQWGYENPLVSTSFPKIIHPADRCGISRCWLNRLISAQLCLGLVTIKCLECADVSHTMWTKRQQIFFYLTIVVNFNFVLGCLYEKNDHICWQWE